MASVFKHSKYLGAFFRAEGNPPYGVFSAWSSVAPQPYPTPGAILTGPSGYCDQIAPNGASIDSSYIVDSTKLSNLINVGARWSRMGASQFLMDGTHIYGRGAYNWTTIDAAQCVSYAYHNIQPVIGLEAGPVEYDAIPGQFSPQSVATYQTPADFGQWCGAVASHEHAVFPNITQFSSPGNEVNSNPGLFPGGEPQIAQYGRACYSAIKAANPAAVVYGFELNMDGGLNTPQFVRDEVALGCGPGTCYDAIAMHLSLRYPIPPASTPCYPNPGGDYSMQCVTDIENASGKPIHVLISEMVYPVPSGVPDEATKATAVTAAFAAYSTDPTIDGVLYGNVDECALYSGFWAGGCLIDTSNKPLPAFYSLQWMASQDFL